MLVFDKRIKSEKIIFNYLNRAEAFKYVGKYGYFADYLDEFNDLTKVTATVLDEIRNVEGCFFCDKAIGGFRYFIPVELLADKAIGLTQKYRPYTLGEFITEFKLGETKINVRNKDHAVESVVLFTGYEDWPVNPIVHLGSWAYSLETLFQKFEIKRWVNDRCAWVPFGQKTADYVGLEKIYLERDDAEIEADNDN